MIEIHKLFPCQIWAEKDIWGTVHIKVQHDGHEEFDFIQIQYNHAYTSNLHQMELAKKIISFLDGENGHIREANDEKKW